MGACAGKHQHLKREAHDKYLPVPIKNHNNNTNDLIVKFRESQNLDNKNIPRIYRLSYLSRDFDPRSFDFSDELCVHILSYLSLEDRLRLESVCQQWQRLIYRSVRTLDYPLPSRLYSHLDGNYMSDKHWLYVSRQVLRKCHFLTKVRLLDTCDTDVLAVLAKNCHWLESIEWRFHNLLPVRREVLSKLCDNCGNSLTCIKVKELDEQAFNSESGLSVLIVYSEYLLNIRTVSVAIDSDKCLKYFQLFADIYNQRITSLEIRLKFSTFYTQLEDTFASIAQFLNLQSLTITLESEYPLDMELSAGASLLAHCCPNLTALTLELRDHIRCTSGSVLESLQPFRSLTSLSVRIRSPDIELGSLEWLTAMSGLTDLQVLYSGLNDEMFLNIDKYCPLVRRLVLKTRERLSNETLYSVSLLKSLRDLRVYCPPYAIQGITDTGVSHLLNHCQNIRNILLECGVKLTEISFLTLNAWANSRPSRSHRFSFCWQRPSEMADTYDPRARLPAHELWPDLLCLPENLTIVCREYFAGNSEAIVRNGIQRYGRQFTWTDPGVGAGDKRVANRESAQSGQHPPQTPPVYYRFGAFPDVVPHVA